MQHRDADAPRGSARSAPRRRRRSPRAQRPRCRRRPAARCRRRGPGRRPGRPPASGSGRSGCRIAGSSRTPCATGRGDASSFRSMPEQNTGPRGSAPPPGPPGPRPPASSAVVSAARTGGGQRVAIGRRVQGDRGDPVGDLETAPARRLRPHLGRAPSLTDRPSGPPDWFRLDGCHPPCPRATRSRRRVAAGSGLRRDGRTAACRSTCTCRSARPAAGTATSTPTPRANWARRRPRNPGWHAALAEIDLAAKVLGAGGDQRPVSTVFVGGGTPSLVGAGPLTGLLTRVRDRFGLAPDAEVTTEANPESTDPRAAGRRCGPPATPGCRWECSRPRRGCCGSWTARTPPGRALDVVGWARDAGFEHVNLDLIYGTPGETDAEFGRRRCGPRSTAASTTSRPTR